MTRDAERRPMVPVAPLFPVALAVAAGIVADRHGDPWGTRAWGLIALAGGASGVVFLGLAPLCRLGLLLAFAALGGGWHHHHWSDLAPDDLSRGLAEEPRPAWIRGVLREVLGVRPGDGPRDSGTTRAVLIVTAIGDGRAWRPASGVAQVAIVGNRPDLGAGQAVEAAGTLALVPGPLNPGEFDYRGYLRAQGIRLRLAIDDPSGIRLDPAGQVPPALRWLGGARAWSHARLVEGLDPGVAPLASALLLGRRDAVDPDVNDAFARTGTTHLLAISGLHLQVLAGALWFAFRALGLGRRGAFAAVGLATIAYALLVGLMPSVVRSAAMTVTVCVAGVRDRRTRPANLLALAALATLALNPAHLFDVGCQLSFLAIVAIVWGVAPASDQLAFAYYALTFRHQGPGSPLDVLERKFEPWWMARMRRWRPIVTTGLVVSLVVWLAALPLVMLRFHVVSPIGILLNLPLIPLTSFALMAAGLTLAASAFSTELAMPFAWACKLSLGATKDLVLWGASRSWGHAFVAGPSWAWVAGLYAALGLATAASVGRWRHRRGAWALAIAWVGLGGAWAVRPRAPGPLEAEVLAVGHGLAVVVQAGDGRAIVYDCGRMRDPSVGRRIVAPALWARGIGRLDAVILSHADSDHYNGLPDLLDRFRIDAVEVPPGFAGPDQGNPGAVRLLDAVRARGVPVREIAQGDRWEAPGATASVRHPPARLDGRPSDNARSVVLDLESGGRHLLLTGDLEQDGLTRLAAWPAPRIDAFLSPHHGGRTANPEWLFAWARPGLVVVSQRPPSPGSRDALAPLDARHVPLFRTWQRGAIRLRWGPGRLEARGFLDPEAELLEGTPPSPGPLAQAAMIRVVPWRVVVSALGFVLGLAGCALLAIVEWGAWALVLPGRRLDAEAVGDDDLAPGEPIETIAPDGVRLAGTWHRAATASGGRTALLVHGFAGARRGSRPRIEALTSRGWDVARIDLRAYGLSGGDRSSFGGREAGDLRAWIDVLAGRSAAPLVLAVWGRSMGAAIAARAAAEDGRVLALVLESPYADLEGVVAGWLRRVRLPMPGVLARLILWRARGLSGVSLSRPRPLDAAPAIAAATLILHGLDDTLVAPAEVVRLSAAFGRPVPRIEVAGAGHGDVLEAGGPELLEQVARFLAERG